MRALDTPGFRKQVERLHPNQRADPDQAIKDLLETPLCGEQKKGDLAWVRVHKFRMFGQLALLAYELRREDNVIILHAVGSHENVYRDLKG